MSADNWAVCPRCEEVRQQGIARGHAEIDAAYGKVSDAEFDSMRAAVTARENESAEHTFREDWEIGIEGDEFSVAYRGGCRECGLSHELRHEERVR